MARFKCGDYVRVRCPKHDSLTGKIGQITACGSFPPPPPFYASFTIYQTDLSLREWFQEGCLEKINPPSSESFQDMMARLTRGKEMV